MKKAILKKLKEIKPMESILKACKEDKPVTKTIYGSYYGERKERKVMYYQYYRFLQAEVEEGILKVGIWHRVDLMRGQQAPEFVIYIDKENEEWLTYQTEEGKWLTGMICNLPYKHMDGEGFGNVKFATEDTRKTIAEYLGTDGTAYKMIRVFQTKKREDILAKWHKSEMDQIDEFMESVPPYPAGYNNDWLLKTGFKDRTNMVYHPGTRNAKCLRCGKEVVLKEKPKHLIKTKCPSCRAEVTLRSWGRQKEIFERKSVGILQRTIGSTDYCLSVQDIGISFKRENDYSEMEIIQYNSARFRLDNHFINHETFEWYEYKYTGMVRWCHAINHGSYYSGYYVNTYCTLYEKNLKELMKDTEMKYFPFADFLRKTNFKQTHVDEMLHNIRKHPDVCEKLVKAGLYKLTSENVMQYHMREDCLNLNAEKLEDILKIDRERMKTAVRMDADTQELKILQAAHIANVRVDDEMIKDLKHLYPMIGVEDLYFHLQRGNLRKEINYLMKVVQQSGNSPSQVARDYRDYLGQLDRLDIARDKHSRFPANFYQTHEMLSEQIRELDKEIAKLDTAKKNRKLKKIVQELKPFYSVPSKQFAIIWPKSKKDFQTEGQKQHNCVGGYFEKMVKQQTVVFFLRKKEDPDTPFCTVEFQSGKLIQCRTIYNGDAPEEAKKYMKKIEAHYEKEMLKKEQIEAAV